MNHFFYCAAIYYTLFWVTLLTAPPAVLAQSMPREDLRSGLLATTADTNASSSINPAATGYDGYSSVRLWVYDPYGIAEIRTQGAGFSRATGSTGFGLSVQSVSYDRLALVHGNVILAREISRSEGSLVRIGLKLKLEYARLSSHLSPRRGHVTAGIQFGILIQILPGIHVGSVIGNWIPTSSRSVSGTGFDAGMGIGIQLSRRTRLLSDIRRTKFFGTDVRVGMEFTPVHVLRIQTGMATNPERFTLGITFALRPVLLHFSVDRHNLLGTSRLAEMELEF